MREWLGAAADSDPDAPFISSGSVTWTYEDAHRRVGEMAKALQARGVAAGTVVALWARNDFESAASIFGIWRAGATVLLLNTRLSATEASAHVFEAGAHLLVGTGAPDLSIPVVDPSSLRASGAAAVELEPERIALIAFTSGSSGRPKGVRLSFRALEASAAGSAQHLDHGFADRWLCNLPIFHIGGVSILVRSARQRSSVLLEPAFDALRTAASMRAGDATIASLVAVTLARTLDAFPGRYTGLKAVLVGGGPVPFDLVERARSAGIPALPTYGMTETASQVATARVDDGKVVPLPGAEIRSEGGRLEVRGDMLFSGYLGERFRGPESWFRTGDLGAVRDDGTIEVEGRADHVIISGGENIHPAEVEAVISEHPGVGGVAVLGVPDETWGQSIVAVYEGDAAPGELERHVRYRLAGFKIPRRWIHVAELPRLSIGKVDAAAVRALVD